LGKNPVRHPPRKSEDKKEGGGKDAKSAEEVEHYTRHAKQREQLMPKKKKQRVSNFMQMGGVPKRWMTPSAFGSRKQLKKRRKGYNLYWGKKHA